MTVVRDERGDGHAVLTARTGQGDFILDNKVADIKSWHKTGYRFVMRQSFVDPRVWMSLDPSDAATSTLLSSSQWARRSKPFSLAASSPPRSASSAADSPGRPLGCGRCLRR